MKQTFFPILPFYIFQSDINNWIPILMLLTKLLFCTYFIFRKQACTFFFLNVKKVFYHRQIQRLSKTAGTGSTTTKSPLSKNSLINRVLSTKYPLFDVIYLKSEFPFTILFILFVFLQHNSYKLKLLFCEHSLIHL